MRWWKKQISKENRRCLSPVGYGGPRPWRRPSAVEGAVQKDGAVLIGLEKNHCCQAMGTIRGGDWLGRTLSSPQQRVGAPVWSLPLDVEGGSAASRRYYHLPWHAGENPLPTQTFLIWGSMRPAVGTLGTPQAAAVGESKREKRLREENLSNSGSV